MSEVQMLEMVTNSPEETEAIAEQIGSRLRGGEVIELASDLGGGKTTFVRGLARGMGSTDHVSSPTFKISNVYKAGELQLQHFDFYRLPEAGIIADELAEVIGQPDVIVVVEWAAVVEDVLPQQRLAITMKPTDENGRQLSFSCPEPLHYLIQGLEQS
jgi:tRNA threonylcarbamoyladenosine biosynthesis protein TsaE